MNDAKHHRDDESAGECDSARRGHQAPEVQLEAVPWGDSRRERAHPLAQRLRRYRAAGPKFLNELNPVEAMEFLIGKMSQTKTNKKFLAMMNT